MVIHRHPVVNLKSRDKEWTKHIFYSFFIPRCLKSSADRKSETVSFAGQKQSGQFFGKSDFSVRIIKINQAKRNIDERTP